MQKLSATISQKMDVTYILGLIQPNYRNPEASGVVCLYNNTEMYLITPHQGKYAVLEKKTNDVATTSSTKILDQKALTVMLAKILATSSMNLSSARTLEKMFLYNRHFIPNLNTIPPKSEWILV